MRTEHACRTVMIFASLLAAAAWSAESAAADPADRAVLFDAAHQLVADNFYDPALQGVDWKAVRDKYRPLAAKAPTGESFAAVINEMLALLRTSHTRYYTPDMPQYYELLGVFESSPAYAEQMKAVRATLPQQKIGYVGIGIDTLATEEGTFILSVLNGGPAEQAGLRVGDRLLNVASEAFHPIRSFASRDGQEIELAIQRHRDAAAESVRVTPRFLEGATMFRDALRQSARVVEAGGLRIGYVHVWSYAGEVYQDILVELLCGGPLKDADALVLDLRDGWGGASPAYLNLFHTDIPLLRMKRPRTGEAMDLDQQWRRPAALLINERVRSGKEAFAWGFKRMGRGPVVGGNTAGAVVAGALHFLPDNTVLYLAVADIEVDGVRLEGQGVAPTLPVERPIPFSAGRDPQLDAALASLLKELQDPSRGAPE